MFIETVENAGEAVFTKLNTEEHSGADCMSVSASLYEQSLSRKHGLPQRAQSTKTTFQFIIRFLAQFQ